MISSTAVGLLLVAALQQPPTFSSGIEAVYLDVFVTAKGATVLGLSAADFEVLDNGVPQTPEMIDTERVPLRVILTLDTSASVAGEKLVQLRAASDALLQGLQPKDEAALLAFSHRLDLRVPPTRDLASIGRALESVQAGGSTAVFDALFAALALRSQTSRPVVVLFTDGEDNSSLLGGQDLRDAVAEAGALVHVVGIEPSVDERAASKPGTAIVVGDLGLALREIAETSGGRIWRAQSVAQLKDTFIRIREEMRTRYVLRYEPRGVEREGRHRLEVRLRGRKGNVHSRREYVVPPPSVPPQQKPSPGR